MTANDGSAARQFCARCGFPKSITAGAQCPVCAAVDTSPIAPRTLLLTGWGRMPAFYGIGFGAALLVVVLIAFNRGPEGRPIAAPSAPAVATAAAVITPGMLELAPLLDTSTPAPAATLTAAAAPAVQTLAPLPAVDDAASVTLVPTSPPVAAVPSATPDVRTVRAAQVEDAWAKRDWPTVINALTDLRTTDPTSGEYVDKLYAAYVAYGDSLLDAGDKPGAGTQFGKAIELAPDRGEAPARAQALTPTPVPTATPKPPAATATPKPPSPTPTSASQIAISGQGRIKSGAGQVFVATTEDAFDSLMKAITRQDQYGVLDLMLAGKVFVVNDGTTVLVLDHGGFLASRVRVRILDGPMTGRSGWLPYEWVVK